MMEGDDVHMAVDIGRVSAVAWHGAAGVDSQALTLGRPGDVAAHLLALDAWLGPLVASVRSRRLYIERHTSRGVGSRTMDAYTGAIRALAARHGVPCDASVTAISARKLRAKAEAARLRRNAVAKARRRAARAATPFPQAAE